MYGMVNKGLEDFVSSDFGVEKWEAILQRAGAEVDVFISNESYPDELTFRLVKAASEVLEVPIQTILEGFGERWVSKIAPENYGAMMDCAGNNLSEFLNNLPNFHSRVALTFPHLQPPKFSVSDVTANSARLHYHSHRCGLQSFVVGLIKGLAKRFNNSVNIQLTRSADDGSGHDIFWIEWSSNPSE